MVFDENKSIAGQIEDYCRSQITTGSWGEESRIPSTKDLALQLGVNPRTVMKAYDSMAAAGLIYQKRGMGYYVSPQATGRMLSADRATFMHDTLPQLARRMRELGIDPETVYNELTRICKDIK